MRCFKTKMRNGLLSHDHEFHDLENRAEPCHGGDMHAVFYGTKTMPRTYPCIHFRVTSACTVHLGVCNGLMQHWDTSVCTIGVRNKSKHTTTVVDNGLFTPIGVCQPTPHYCGISPYQTIAVPVYTLLWHQRMHYRGISVLRALLWYCMHMHTYTYLGCDRQEVGPVRRRPTQVFRRLHGGDVRVDEHHLDALLLQGLDRLQDTNNNINNTNSNARVKLNTNTPQGKSSVAPIREPPPVRHSVVFVQFRSKK